MTSRPIDRVAASLSAAERIAVLTGAGISTESGIPDFRGPNGVWTTKPESMKLVAIEDYVRDPGVRAEAWQERMRHPAWTAEPNAGHRALVELERRG
ncbi:MAG: SIR2 family NAD-dependent protein deacylase, partial [Actinomycetota bacterium]